MLSDGQALLLLLTLLYLSDCLMWVTKQSVPFVSQWGRRWRIPRLNSSFGNSRGGILFLNPLPPLGRVFLSHLSPISISPVGICALNLQTLPSLERPPAQTGRFLPFTEITGASTDSKYLIVNKQRFTKCASSKQAKAISKLINAAVGASVSDRAGMVRAFIANQFATDEAAALLQKADVIIRRLRWICLVLFLFLFVATPLLVSVFGLLRLIIPIGILTIVLAVQISVVYFRAHKKLYPEETQERFENVVKMVLCPPVSIRAADLLTKHLLSEYSPIVIVALLSPSAGQQFVRAFILDLQHPLKHEVSDKKALEVVSWAATEQLRMCLDHVEGRNYSETESLLAPPRPDGDSISYCPRCGCQFLVSFGGCPDCPGVGLLTFANQREIDTGGSR
jgi:hypothetical protein